MGVSLQIQRFEEMRQRIRDGEREREEGTQTETETGAQRARAEPTLDTRERVVQNSDPEQERVLDLTQPREADTKSGGVVPRKHG
jgi:hypothetical protein